MNLSAISHDDDFSPHTMYTPESSTLNPTPPKSPEEHDFHSHIVHRHQRIHVTRQQTSTGIFLTDLNPPLPPADQSQRLKTHVESMSVEELRMALLDKAKEMHRLRIEIQTRTEENFHLRHQLTMRRTVSRSRGSTPTSIHSSTLCEYSAGDSFERELITNDNDHFLVSEDDLKMRAEPPSRISVMLSQSMTVLAQINNEEVLERVCAGSQIAKKIGIGTVAGYFSFMVLKRFGKLAATSILGSTILIKMAHHRGYISVDWNRIQKHIEASSNPEEVEQENPIEDDIAWVSQKIQQFRQWSLENQYTVIGFWTGVFLHSFHS